MTYIVSEPAPATTSYQRCGRGGAGNIRVSTSTHSASHSTAATLSSSAVGASRRFFSGIGGAGNVHKATERPALSLDEAFRRADARDNAEVGHCGIGDAGNIFRRKQDTKSEDSASDSSSTSSKSKLWTRVGGSFSRS